jgi:hypothetical protein
VYVLLAPVIRRFPFHQLLQQHLEDAKTIDVRKLACVTWSQKQTEEIALQMVLQHMNRFAYLECVKEFGWV